MSSVEIVEVSPRDGLQNDPASLSVSQKVRLVAEVVASGARRVEVTSFVSPRAVPKMADAEQVVGALRSSGLAGVRLVGLVVNERGVARAASAKVDEVNVVVVATDTFSVKNQGAATADCVARLRDLVAAAHESSLGVSVTVGASFGCPFEGEVPMARLEHVLAGVAATRPEELCLADTIGVAVPKDVRSRLALAREVAGPGTRLRAHFHDTRNTAVANALAAVEEGVQALDASLGGLGGCPFAPKATGNLATEDLVYALGRSGVGTGMDLSRLIAASEWLAEVVGHPLGAKVSRAGAFP